MATKVIKSLPHTQAFCDAHNLLKKQIGAGSFIHLDAYENPIASANATDLPTALILANEMMGVYLFHISDLLAHKAASTPPALVKATDLASAITLANAIKADHNTQDGSTTYHYTADTADEATTNASDLGTLETLLNALKATINTHMASAPSAPSLRTADL